MEKNIWKPYRQINHHPALPKYFDTVSSVLHSICCTDNISWKEAYRRLIHSSAVCGTMPSDRHSIRKLLSECGFFIQAGAYAERPVADIIKECNEIFHDGEQVIINLYNSPEQGLYMPVVPVRTNGIRHYELQYPKELTQRTAAEVWIRWKDRQDHSIAPRRKGGRTAKKKEMTAKDNEALIVYNENPTENIVGDCAIRALAGVLEISWEEAVWKLVEAGDYICTQINLTTNIEKCLEREGFEKHGPIKKNGRILTGKEFCDLIHDMFPAGTRLYAYPGNHHAAAILVFNDDYKIVDTWDSTNKPIKGYWAKYPEKRERPSKKIIIDDSLTELHEDMRIVHKVYGVGTIISISKGITAIRFADGAEKKLAEKWIIDNCKKVLDDTL